MSGHWGKLHPGGVGVGWGGVGSRRVVEKGEGEGGPGGQEEQKKKEKKKKPTRIK